MTILAVADWQMRASTAYQWTRGQSLARMQDELAKRIHGLTGHSIAPDAIFVDRDAHQATVAIDGTIFRLRYQDLLIVRPCVECGGGHFESAPITDLPALGYALGVWQPRCKHCPAEEEAPV